MFSRIKRGIFWVLYLSHHVEEVERYVSKKHAGDFEWQLKCTLTTVHAQSVVLA